MLRAHMSFPRQSMAAFHGELDVPAATADLTTTTTTSTTTTSAADSGVVVEVGEGGASSGTEEVDVTTTEEVAEVATGGIGSGGGEEVPDVAMAMAAEAAVEVAAEMEVDATMGTGCGTVAEYVPTEEEQLAAGRHERSRKRPATEEERLAFAMEEQSRGGAAPVGGSGSSGSGSVGNAAAVPTPVGGSGSSGSGSVGSAAAVPIASSFVWEAAAAEQAKRDLVQQEMEERIKEIERENRELKKGRVLEERTMAK